MFIGEQQPKPERTLFFLIGAVKRVPVTEFLQLRFRNGGADTVECKQMYDGEKIIRTQAEGKEDTYHLTDEIEEASDPWVTIARQIVRHMPLSKYLKIRLQAVNSTIAHIETRQERLISLNGLFGSNEELDEANDLMDHAQADLRLTKKVIAAAKINLSFGWS